MPAIKKPSEHFDAKIRTGAGGGSVTVSGVGFQPDLVWTKSRSQAYDHMLADSVRGTTKALRTNLTALELTADSWGYLSAFNSDGYTAVPGGANFNSYGTSAVTYVDWMWKAGGTAVANTAGSIASQVSVNSTAGFSIVTYTSPNTLVNETVGHGLSATPEFIITKNRDASWNWDIWHKNLSSGYGLVFAADAPGAGRWPTTTPTNSVFSVKYNYEHVSTNRFVAYCWTPIAGYSAFGSYTGNGSSDGPFIYTGFKPAFILTKNISNGSYWWEMVDNKRVAYNTTNVTLYANVTDTEYSGSTYNKDLLSNGFKIRGDTAGSNESGSTMIYAAFAESPFKFANAR